MTAHPDRFTRIGEVLARARTEFDRISAGQSQPTSDASRADLIDLLAQALPYVEEAASDPAYKAGAVGKLVRAIRAAIEGEQA